MVKIPKEIILIKIAELKEYGKNARTHTAEQLGRRCNMMELDPRYCSVIIARYEQLTGEKAIRIN